jgi:hypothetical protein
MGSVYNPEFPVLNRVPNLVLLQGLTEEVSLPSCCCCLPSDDSLANKNPARLPHCVCGAWKEALLLMIAGCLGYWMTTYSTAHQTEELTFADGYLVLELAGGRPPFAFNACA